MFTLAIAAITALLIFALFVRATLFSSLQVRKMRWRTRMRLRPGPGFASHWEITIRWGFLAALYHGKRYRPDMSLWQRLIRPVTDYSIRLGRTQGFRRIFARGEDMVGIIAPQRTNKSGILADQIWSHPGAVVSVTTRADIFRNTVAKRAQLGPVDVFNPEGVGGVPSTFRVDIISECVDPDIALRTAAALVGPSEDAGDMSFWLSKAVNALAALLHAAALLGRDVDSVLLWASRMATHEVRTAATLPAAVPQLLAHAAELDRDSKSSDSVRMTLNRSLAWVSVPCLRDMVAGEDLRLFDAAEWVRSRGTVYFIASGEGSTSEPLFRAVVEKLYRDCVHAGSLTPYGRLPVPPLFALDEVTQTCSVPLNLWLATAAGSGCSIRFVVHTPAQLVARYGKPTADAIWALAGTKVILGGNSDIELAQAISDLCGHYGDEKSEKVVPVAYLRQLPESRALVISGPRSPIAVKVRPVWRRMVHRKSLRPLMTATGLLPVYHPAIAPEPVVQIPEPVSVPEIEPALEESAA